MMRRRSTVAGLVVIGSLFVTATAGAQSPFVDPNQPAANQYQVGQPAGSGGPPAGNVAAANLSAGGSGARPSDAGGNVGGDLVESGTAPGGSGAAPADAGADPVTVRAGSGEDPTRTLPFTGSDTLLLALIGLLLLALGTLIALVVRARRDEQAQAQAHAAT